MKLKKPKFWKSINFLSMILLPLSLITLLMICVKNILTKKNKFSFPIICVGNIFLGGTGKTPLSIHLYNLLLKRKMKPALVRKYYQSHFDEIRFTKAKIKNFFTNVSRLDAIKKAESKKCNVVIMDDGLQDISINKNLNIVCFNGNELVGNGLIIPAGPLREPMNSLKYAKIIIINGKKNLLFKKKLRTKSPDAKIFYSTYVPNNINKLKRKKILAFAGIGNPSSFFELLEKHNLNLIDKISFPDHYDYNKNEILDLIQIAKKKKMKLVTTEKDYYRLKRFGFSNIHYVSIDLKIENERSFKKELFKYL